MGIKCVETLDRGTKFSFQCWLTAMILFALTSFASHWIYMKEYAIGLGKSWPVNWIDFKESFIDLTALFWDGVSGMMLCWKVARVAWKYLCFSMYVSECNRFYCRWSIMDHLNWICKPMIKNWQLTLILKFPLFRSSGYFSYSSFMLFKYKAPFAQLSCLLVLARKLPSWYLNPFSEI